MTHNSKKYGKGGWFNESYRHSLASRGVKTAKYMKRKRPLQQKYFARGNRAPELVAAGHAKGFEDAKLKGNEALLDQLIEGSEKRSKWPPERKRREKALALAFLEKDDKFTLPTSTSRREEREFLGGGALQETELPTYEPPFDMSPPPATEGTIEGMGGPMLPEDDGTNAFIDMGVGGNEETIMTPGVPERSSSLDFNDSLAYTSKKRHLQGGNQ